MDRALAPSKPAVAHALCVAVAAFVEAPVMFTEVRSAMPTGGGSVVAYRSALDPSMPSQRCFSNLGKTVIEYTTSIVNELLY